MAGNLIKLTNAGRAALVGPGNVGTITRTVVSVGIATAPFAHDVDMLVMPNERKRLTSIGGENVAPDTIHVTIQDESADQYQMYGFGLYLDNGVLLGTYSQDTPVMEKSPAAMLLLAADILFTTIDAAALVFGDAGFLNPPATTTVKGVVELADNAETQAGMDVTRAVTPAGLASRTATATRTGLVELATDAEAQTGTDTTRAVTPANLSARTATEARTGLLEIATQSEVDQGTDDARAVTAKKLLARLKLLGFGGTGTEGTISDLDDATVPGGLLYVPGAATNVPMNLGPGVVLHRVYGTAGLQLFSPYQSNRIVFRRRTGSAWQAWQDLALLDSPAFGGTPTVPTAARGTNTRQIASTEYVMAAMADLVDSSPGALDTLKELAAALGNDPNFATTVLTELGKKFDKAGGVVGMQTSGWDGINTPTMRVLDGSNSGKAGGLAVESYAPVVQLIDRTVNVRNARLLMDAHLLRIGFDSVATPGAYTDLYTFHADGYMSLGPATSSAVALRLGTTIAGGATTQYGVYNNTEFNELATAGVYGYHSVPRLKDAPFTANQVAGFNAAGPVLGAQASLTNYDAYIARDYSNAGATRISAALFQMAAGPNKWNLYSAGTAPGFHYGTLQIGSTADDGSSAKLQVTGYATADTPPTGDSTRKLATTAWVMSTLLNAAIGQIIIEPRATVRAGCLKLNGALLNRSAYPELWTYAQASGNLVSEAEWQAGMWGAFSTGDGQNTFRIPEYRGEGLRFWDDGRGVDAGRKLGSYQAPQNLAHSHGASSSWFGDHNHSAWTDAQGWHGHGVHDPTHAHTYDVPPPASNPDGQGAASGSSWLDLTQYGQRGTYGAYTGISIAGDGSHGHNVGIGWAGGHFHAITINADGGAEVRVRTISALAMIRAF
ncbi:hypothetical protein [Cupriavidus sp. AcVe19-1a]|uniref:hypothetical protein n=1 Tax=Cupriavidus sp. AcVe19-1a TaxID=2821359 RepID=UPI001AE1250C|nr:hypothetical protein [Cupriavidus sp. AcVe19-1a]MBP0633294.1 hypothetical protein [Cupriavidus sp. AcVe19-1a]